VKQIVGNVFVPNPAPVEISYFLFSVFQNRVLMPSSTNPEFYFLLIETGGHSNNSQSLCITMTTAFFALPFPVSVNMYLVLQSTELKTVSLGSDYQGKVPETFFWSSKLPQVSCIKSASMKAAHTFAINRLSLNP
jgi:hypothetical protein